MTARRLDHLSELQKEGFVIVDAFSLTTDDGDLVISSESRSLGKQAVEGAPSVYAWVACRGDIYEVIYVGLASKGWLVRRGQHLQGLRLTGGAGGKNRLGLIDELQGEAQVRVLERHAGWIVAFGVSAPTHGAEEWALLARFKPRLNRLSDIERAVAFADVTGATI